MIAKINDDETIHNYVTRLVNEAFNEVIEDVDVKLVDEIGIYREYASEGDVESVGGMNKFMTAYPYRSLNITINFFDKTINLKKDE